MVCTKVVVCALVLLSLLSLAQSYGSDNFTAFSFPSFGNSNSDQLIFLGNASLNSSSNGHIDLTPPHIPPRSSNRTADPYSEMKFRYGRVLYREPITVWPVTFTTTFTICIKNISAHETVNQPMNRSGDGMAFIIVPSYSVLPYATGSYMGIFNKFTNGSATNQLAIEFDTFKNAWDPNGNHVGIDTNSVISIQTANFSQYGIDIKLGRPIRVRIHYDGWNKTLQVYATYADQPIPYALVLNCTIELYSTVPRSAFLGFSASTGGGGFEFHRILDWNFSSEILPYSSLNIDPVGPTGPGDGLNIAGEGSTSRGLKVCLLVGFITVAVVLSGLSAWIVTRAMKRRRGAGPIVDWGLSEELEIMPGRSPDSLYGPHRFSYKRLSAATQNFRETELLGTGGFGGVYKGTLKGQDGTVALVAVKRICVGSRQGEREFISEISTIGRLRHRNLVRLQGWCHKRDKLLLVYDYMLNGSLDKLIFRKTADHHQNQIQPLLNWARRHRILCGLASALLYLHEEWEKRVVHRDVKPSNVMLDGDFNARLGDFGLARLIEHDKSSPAVTTSPAGTPGYWAPECGYTGKATTKSDVFSFGVVVLEVASGRRVVERTPQVEEENLIDWLWGLYGHGEVIKAADPRLEGDFEEEQMKRTLILGLACSHPDPQLRPSIRQALQILINPTERLMLLPSSRPLAPLNSHSTSPYLNAGLPGLASTNSAHGRGGASITASILHYGR